MQVVWLFSRAVRATGADEPALGWDELGGFDRDHSEIHEAAWSVMAGVVTARLLAASGGRRPVMPAGMEILGDVLDALLPYGPGGRTVVAAGPGLAADGAGVALVPEHPQSGETWRGDVATAIAVPYAMWRFLTFRNDARRLSAALTVRAALLDDPAPTRVPRVTPDLGAFVETLSTVPEVREPWLRAVYDRYTDRWRPSWPFW
ncbi:hypothetical protein [Herbidospora daliensis]|uniref:hypothetical protein n=1 Tax=Herbidospora daliensis TaxID=295585 RepID=UPI0012F8A3AD|nr:hypothetical protein [Herbidospora daliensis]